MQPVSYFLRRIDDSYSFTALFVVCLVVLAAFITPHGTLSDNEEHYLAVAKTFYNQNAPAPQRDRGNLNHTPVFGHITGLGVNHLGYEATQIIGRALVILLFSLALTRYAIRFRLSPIDITLLLVTFYLYGQYIIGEDWLFEGYEPKSLAYAFLILAIVDCLSLRPGKAIGWFIVATYLHIQVGVYWFAFTLLFILLQQRDFRLLFKYAGVYVLAVLPLIIYILAGHHDLYSANPDGTAPTANQIFSLYRFPHHVSPFSDLWNFIHWVPDISRLLVITLLCFALYTYRKNEEQKLATLNMIVFCFLLTALLLSAVDRNTGYLGPLLLFRPSSVALLLFFTQLILYLKNTLPDEQSTAIRASLLLFFLSWAAPVVSQYQLETITDKVNNQSEQASLFEYIEDNTKVNDIFLIAPNIENYFLGFERHTTRSAFVLYKFLPTSRSGILDWYKRSILQKEIAQKGCADKTDYKIDYLILSRKVDSGVILSCGSQVFASEKYILVKTG